MSTSEDLTRSAIDLEHLRLLSIFHFVSAGLAFVGVAFATFYFAMIQAMFAHPEIWARSPQGPPPGEFMGVFRWFLGLILVWLLLSALGNLFSGLFLRARRHRTFSMVVAALNCLHIPFGTLLGIFTFIVLGRDSIRTLYRP